MFQLHMKIIWKTDQPGEVYLQFFGSITYLLFQKPWKTIDFGIEQH